MLVTSGKLSLGTRGNTYKRSHTGLSRVPASFRNQFSLNYLAPIPNKVASLHLTCVLSAVAKRIGTQQFPGSKDGEEILNPESLSGPKGLTRA